MVDLRAQRPGSGEVFVNIYAFTLYTGPRGPIYISMYFQIHNTSPSNNHKKTINMVVLAVWIRSENKKYKYNWQLRCLP